MRHLKTLSDPGILAPQEVDRLLPALERVCPGGPVALLYLHGAHARGSQGALSDLDLAVLLDPAAVEDHRAQLDLLASLQAASGREDVDLTVLNRAGPGIKVRVVRDGRIVYARSRRERVIFEARAILEALDFEHYSRVYDRALFRRLREAPRTRPGEEPREDTRGG